MAQVQVRMPDGDLEHIDEMVKAGRFSSRSDAIRSMVAFYRERDKTLGFLGMLEERSKNARDYPEDLIELD